MKRAFLIVLAFAFAALMFPPAGAIAQDDGDTEEPAEKPAAAPAKPAEQPAATEPAKPEEPAAAPESVLEKEWPWQPEKALKITGLLEERYRVRDTSGESDQDSMSIIEFKLENIVPDKLSLYFNMAAFWDTFGHQDDRGKYELFYFEDVYDSYEVRAQGRLYALYLEYSDVLEGLDLKFGRQTIHKGHHLHLDGLSLDYKPAEFFNLTLAGGIPVYFSEPEWITNFIAAAYLDFYPGELVGGYPGKATKITFEYIHAHEGGPNLDDDYMSVQIWQKLFGGAGMLYLKAGFLNGETHDVAASCTWRCPYSGLQLRLHYYGSPSTLGDGAEGEHGEYTTDFSSFNRIMGVYKPFHQFNAVVYKQFAESLGIEVGYNGRMLAEGDEGDFNHDYDRVFGSAFLYDPFGLGLDVTLTGEYWHSDGPSQNNDNATWGVDLSYKPDRRIRMSVGSHFLKYRTTYEPDTYTRIDERSDVRLFTLALDIEPLTDFRIGVRYEFESDEGWHDRSFDTLEVRAGLRF